MTFFNEFKQFVESRLQEGTISSEVYNTLAGKGFSYLFLLVALKFIIKFLFIVGLFLLVKKIMKSVQNKILKLEEKNKHVDKSLLRFSLSVARAVVYLIFAVAVLRMFGLSKTEIATIVGAAGVGIGFALKDIAANFIGGVTLLVAKPFKIGQVVDINGSVGEVTEITIFATELTTADNKVIFIPNGKIVITDVTNFSANHTRKVEIFFSISYNDDFEKAKKILREIAYNHPKIIKDEKHEPLIRVRRLAESSVDIIYRVICKTNDYWDVYSDSIETAKLEFDKAGITIPFPQRDLNIKSEEKLQLN